MRSRDEIIAAIEELQGELESRLKDLNSDGEFEHLPRSLSLSYHYRREVEKLRKALAALG